jgi:hypothetical protein
MAPRPDLRRTMAGAHLAANRELFGIAGWAEFVALTHHLAHAITQHVVVGGGSDSVARLVNGFVNETRHNCAYGVERRVVA